MTSDRLHRLYLPHVAAARGRLETDARLGALLAPDIAPATLLRFLIQFSARGVQMTEPVESWIRRAGERCVAVGLPELGDALITHARHEAGHHHLMIADTELLVGRWNAQQPAHKLEVARLLGQSATAAMDGYVRLHEDTIVSDAPYCQVAIELEIEHLSTVLGPPLIAHCQRVLGPEILAGLSFIVEHVAVDVGHTALNERMLDRLLAARPGEAARLGAAGARALDLYIAFLGDCADEAAAAVAADALSVVQGVPNAVAPAASASPA